MNHRFETISASNLMKINKTKNGNFLPILKGTYRKEKTMLFL